MNDLRWFVMLYVKAGLAVLGYLVVTTVLGFPVTGALVTAKVVLLAVVLVLCVQVMWTLRR